MSMSFIWEKIFEIMLQLSIAVHWLAKFLLNMLALASNLVISSLFTFRRGILDTFFLLHKVLRVAYYIFMDLEASPSFFPKCMK